MTEKQTPGEQHGEDDLLADFRDVLGDDDSGDKPQPDETTTDLDALDAFLNEFGQGGSAQSEVEVAEEAPQQALDEVAAAAEDEPVGGMDLDLDTLTDEVDVPELSVASEVAPDDLNLDVVEDMAAPEPPQRSAARGFSGDLFSAAPAAPAAAAAAPVSIMAADDESPTDSKTLDVSTIGVALFSLVIAAVAAWFAVSLHGQMNDLRAELAQLRQQPAGVIAGPDRQTQDNLALLSQRVNEMAVLLDGPMSHMSDTGTQLNAVNARLEELEQRLAGLREHVTTAERPAQPVAKAPEPPKAAAPAPQPAPKPVATASKPAASGSWVVNVASLTDAKAAATEQQRLKQAGFNVEVKTAQMEGRTWYRVRTGGFSSREEAQVYSDMIRHKMGVTPWVGLDK